jgi:hypothetical protein
MKTFAVAISVSVLSLTFALPVDAVVLCAKQRSDGTFNSSVRIREACKSRETQLDPVALGLEGPQGEQGQQGEPGQAGSFEVQDGLGNTVGTLIGKHTNGFFTVLEPTSGKALTLVQFGRSDGTGVDILPIPSIVGIRFSGLNCTGQAYISFGENVDPATLYVFAYNTGITDHRFFAPDQLAAQGTPTFSDLDGNGECDNNAGVSLPAASYTATEVIVSFPVPFVGPLEIVAAP